MIKRDQLVNVVAKEWGHEEWIVNKPEYCGKKMVFKPGFQCSMHHHKIKDETFYVIQGQVYLELEDNKQRTTRIMEPGDTAHIKPLVWHRLTALTPAEVIEFSTFHREDDSYRRTQSGHADFLSMGISHLVDATLLL